MPHNQRRPRRSSRFAADKLRVVNRLGLLCLQSEQSGIAKPAPTNDQVFRVGPGDQLGTMIPSVIYDTRVSYGVLY